MVELNAGPPPLDLTHVRAGDDTTIQVTLHVLDQPVDLTGCTVTAQARLTADKADPAAVAAVCTITDGPGGVFTMTWPGDGVRALMPPPATTWTGFWDVQVAATGGKIRTVAAGKFLAEMDVTRP